MAQICKSLCPGAARTCRRPSVPRTMTAAPLLNALLRTQSAHRRTLCSAAMSSLPAFLTGPGSDELRAKSCGGQCGKDVPKLSGEDLAKYMLALPAWELNSEGTSMSRTFIARNFTAAIDFFNKVKGVAEEEGHHPDLHLTDYRTVQIVMSTHSVGGLTMPDVIVAAKLDTLEVEYSPKWLRQQTESTTE